jgi:antitoxin ParD1/3/4
MPWSLGSCGYTIGTVEKITIALTREMAGFIKGAVDSGEYASTSEAIRDAVREWKERRDLLGYTVEELRVLVQDGLDSGPSSRSSMEEIKAEARRRFDRSTRQG